MPKFLKSKLKLFIYLFSKCSSGIYSLGSLIAVLNLTIDNAPTKPSDMRVKT